MFLLDRCRTFRAPPSIGQERDDAALLRKRRLSPRRRPYLIARNSSKHTDFITEKKRYPVPFWGPRSQDLLYRQESFETHVLHHRHDVGKTRAPKQIQIPLCRERLKDPLETPLLIQNLGF